MMRIRFQSGLMPAVAVFSGSFLLFMLQPMLGRTLLPVFGGSAAVWSVCLAAYQALLLAGYAYAHLLAGKSARAQRTAHVALLGAAVAWAFVFAALRATVKGFFGASPVPALEVLFCVLVFVGLPYVLLASGSTLVQSWVAGTRVPERGEAGREVYSLYAVSNLGSLTGLLIFPFLLEPFVPLTVQWYGFATGLGLYALLVARLGKRFGAAAAGAAGAPGQPAEADRGQPELRALAQSPVNASVWFMLPAVSAFLLNAVIAHLFIDVTPMPLVWVVMLAVFLLSYVVGFSRFGEGRRGVWAALSALALTGAALTNGMWGTGSFYPNAASAMALVFCAGVLLHGWLYAERPDTAHLTRFYLMIAAGGAAGGLASSLVAPLVFNRVLEYPLVLLVCALLVAWRAPKPALVARSRAGVWVFTVCCGAAWLLLSAATARHTQSRTVFRDRNFYGSLAVTQTFEQFGPKNVLPVHYLWFGQTTHGIQVRAPEFKNRGTAYFGQTGGGIAFHAHPRY
jgi:hypothetical protein